jgi:uncharacterized protein YecE (DUF72 family)
MDTRRSPEWRIGCSGWSYRHWRDAFYPQGLPARRWLDHYASRFDTVELNNTFYRLPSADAIDSWRGGTPAGFCFAVKASRLITHNKRLANSGDLLDAFFARVRGLGDRLGPLLYQLPPAFERDDSRLAAFLDLLPDDLTHVFEFRNESWWHADIYALLQVHGAAFCIYNLGQRTTPLIRTCDDVYVRFHGPQATFASSYSDPQLRRWEQRLALLGGRRVWAYFNNDVGGHAPRNAARLKQIVERRRGM